MFERDYTSIQSVVTMLRKTIDEHPKHAHDILESYKKQEKARIHYLQKEILHEQRFFKLLHELESKLKGIKDTEHVSEEQKKKMYALLEKLENEIEIIENEVRHIQNIKMTG